MLIKCPECDLQVSEHAKSCPHCGFPMFQPINIPIEPTKTPYRGKHMRLPNGFGQISKIKGKLRKPYRAMITVGKDQDGRPICKLLRPEAYFNTYNEAYSALMEYNKHPYDFENCITVKELYDSWFDKYKGKLTASSSVRTIESAWSYCSGLYDVQVQELRTRHIKWLIDSVDASENIKNRIKSIFNLMLDYAVEYEIVQKNCARDFNLESVNKGPNKEHIPFSDEELNILWNNTDNPYVCAILVQTYTGFRPQELCKLKVENINLEDRTIIGGMKTKAGTNRLVPIHSKIYEITKKLKSMAIMQNSEYFLYSYKDGTELTYDKYNKRFHKVMGELGLNTEHRPHDPRKTFVTMCKQREVNEYAIKRIIGHTITDLTEAVYTVRDINWLSKEIEKI